MKKRTDGRYCKQIMVGYLPDGRRKMKNIYGKTKQEVEKKERELKNEIDKGVNFCDTITVGEWADTWLKTFKTDIAHNTYTRYEGIIDKQIKPMIGSRDIKNILPETIQKMINELSARLAPATVKKIRDVMHQMFEQALVARYISINPVKYVRLPPLTQKHRDAISDEEVTEITKFCKTYEQGAFIMTLLYTGMRRGEILALTKDDIDFNALTITINKAVEFVDDEPKIKSPKTPKSYRTIPILEPLIPYLREMANATNKYLFTKDGKLYGKASIESMFRTFLRRYNEYLNVAAVFEEKKTVKYTMHQFRHTFCTLLYKAGVDVKTIQDLLGHSSIGVTLDIYTHLDKTLKLKNIDKLNNYLGENIFIQ